MYVMNYFECQDEDAMKEVARKIQYQTMIEETSFSLSVSRKCTMNEKEMIECMEIISYVFFCLDKCATE